MKTVPTKRSPARKTAAKATRSPRKATRPVDPREKALELALKRAEAAFDRAADRGASGVAAMRVWSRYDMACDKLLAYREARRRR